MIGKRILHYKILEELGRGGMGVVYKAHDSELERDVAIKFLPRHIASDANERERFKIEAKAAAALNHANIATIYAIEKSDDESFIVMEYIDGQELKDKIASGPIAIADAIATATQIGRGLQAAHEKGVVHRDIKSSNIMLTSKGDVKIMDFGLAKLRGQSKLTVAGTTLGTAAYMSPEQAKGEDVDHRSDIFSLGVLIYEMLTGQLPFKGDYEQAVTYSILSEEPAPITGLRTGVPVELERIVHKCLRKTASDRYQHVDELIVDLKSARGGTSGISQVSQITTSKAPNKKKGLYIGLAGLLIVLVLAAYYFLNKDPGIDSIAVLPFVNTANDPDIDYLSDGITETLITRLSQLPQLQVMARSTVFQFKETSKTPQQIGRELGVRAVLAGEIVQRGDILRLHAELVKVADGIQIWGDQYNRTADDIFDIQDDISEQISSSLALKLKPEDKTRLTKRHTNNTEAYQLYLKGRYFWNKRTGEDLKTAKGYFEEAIGKDPTYAMAFVGLAETYVISGYYAVLPSAEAFQRAKRSALEALQIDDQLAQAYSVLGNVASNYDFDWASAEENYQKSIALNPNYATARQWYGEDLSMHGRIDESIEQLEQAMAIDPLSLIVNTIYGLILSRAGHHSQAIKQFEKTLEMDPDYNVAQFLFGEVLLSAGKVSEGINHLLEAKRQNNAPATLAALGYAYAISGKTKEAKQILTELDHQASQGPVPPYCFATVHAGLGNKEEALQYLELSLEQREFVLMLNVEPFWDSLRSEPRFREILRKVGLER